MSSGDSKKVIVETEYQESKLPARLLAIDEVGDY
jgi:hypothetical protein